MDVPDSHKRGRSGFSLRPLFIRPLPMNFQLFLYSFAGGILLFFVSLFVRKRKITETSKETTIKTKHFEANHTQVFGRANRDPEPCVVDTSPKNIEITAGTFTKYDIMKADSFFIPKAENTLLRLLPNTIGESPFVARRHHGIGHNSTVCSKRIFLGEWKGRCSVCDRYENMTNRLFDGTNFAESLKQCARSIEPIEMFYCNVAYMYDDGTHHAARILPCNRATYDKFMNTFKFCGGIITSNNMIDFRLKLSCDPTKPHDYEIWLINLHSKINLRSSLIKMNYLWDLNRVAGMWNSVTGNELITSVLRSREI